MSRTLPESLKKPTTKEQRDFLKQEKDRSKRSAITKKQLDALMKLYFDEKFLFGRDRIFEYISTDPEYKPLNISRRQVNRFLQHLTIQQLFAPKKKQTSEIQKYVPKKPFSRVQMDLIDMSAFEDRGYNFILTAIDTFSKYGFAIPMKGKTEQQTYNAIKKLIKDMLNLGNVKSVLSDNGSEFVNKRVQKLFESNDITQIYSKAGTPQSHGNVENFNLFVRRLISKYRVQFDSNKWKDYLPKLIENYNKTKSRVTGQAPEDILKDEDYSKTKEKIEKEIIPKNRDTTEHNLEVGDLVRLKQETGTVFEKKSMNINWSNEIYEIVKIYKPKKKTVLQPSYKIKNVETDEEINERFYPDDLLKIPKDSLKDIEQPELYEIEKLIKTVKQKGQTLVEVKWKGYDETSLEPLEKLRADVPKLVKKFLKE